MDTALFQKKSESLMVQLAEKSRLELSKRKNHRKLRNLALKIASAPPIPAAFPRKRHDCSQRKYQQLLRKHSRRSRTSTVAMAHRRLMAPPKHMDVFRSQLFSTKWQRWERMSIQKKMNTLQKLSKKSQHTTNFKRMFKFSKLSVNSAPPSCPAILPMKMES